MLLSGIRPKKTLASVVAARSCRVSIGVRDLVQLVLGVSEVEVSERSSLTGV
jgi:hypothetical protein